MEDDFNTILIQYYRMLRSEKMKLQSILGPGGICSNDMLETIFRYAKVLGKVEALEWVAEHAKITLPEETK